MCTNKENCLHRFYACTLAETLVKFPKYTFMWPEESLAWSGNTGSLWKPHWVLTLLLNFVIMQDCRNWDTQNTSEHDTTWQKIVVVLLFMKVTYFLCFTTPAGTLLPSTLVSLFSLNWQLILIQSQLMSQVPLTLSDDPSV